MRNAFVIGHPISHSKSPILHTYWLNHHQIDGSYEAIDVAPQNLPNFIADLRKGKYVGGNVTVPHKEAILPFCDTVTDAAKTIGAVNTIWTENGRVCGDNSDKYGFLANLDQVQKSWAKRKKRAIVLGAGGAARAILVALYERGFEQIIILNRTVERAKKLADALNMSVDGAPFQADQLEAFDNYAPHTDFLVNTSAVGLNGTQFEGLSLSQLNRDAVVTDIVYTPLQTPLLKQAEHLGHATIDGLGMLLHQAVPGFKRWFGQRPQVTETLRTKILRTS